MTDGTKSVTVYASTMYEFKTSRENVAEPVSGIKGIPPYGNYLHYSNYYFIEGSSSVNFMIDTSPTATPSVNNDSGSGYKTNILLYTIGIITLLIVAAALLVYHKRRTKQFSPETFTGLSQGSCTRSLITKTLPTIKW